MWPSSRINCHTEVMYYPAINPHKDESHIAGLKDDAGVVEAIRVA